MLANEYIVVDSVYFNYLNYENNGELVIVLLCQGNGLEVQYNDMVDPILLYFKFSYHKKVILM